MNCCQVVVTDLIPAQPPAVRCDPSNVHLSLRARGPGFLFIYFLFYPPLWPQVFGRSPVPLSLSKHAKGRPQRDHLNNDGAISSFLFSV